MISKRYNIKNWTRKNLSDWFKKMKNPAAVLNLFVQTRYLTGFIKRERKALTKC